MSLYTIWDYIELKDCFELQNGINFNADQKGIGLLVIDVLNMYSDDLYVRTDRLYRIDIKVPKERLLRPGDILFVRSSVKESGVGWPAIFKGHEEPVTYCGFLIRARQSEIIFDPRFLVHYLRQPHIRAQMISRAGKVAITNINQERLGSLKIPRPPLPEQKRIAAILDKADAVRRKRQEAIRLLDEFLRSVFLEMFGDPVRDEKGWPIKSFKELAKIDTNMTEDFDSYAEMPHIGIENIEKNTGRLIDYTTVKESSLKSGKYIFTSEHIIYSKIRPNLNKVALPSFAGLCSADSYPILVNKNLCNRYFLAFIMRSKCFLDFIIGLSSRTNIPKVNKEQLNSFECICPPISIQNEYAQIVNKTEKQKQLLEQSLIIMETSFNSLMQKAFRGEL